MNHYCSVFFQAACAALVGCASIGCGKGNSGPSFDLTPVSGVITLDGKPLPDADVAFYLDGPAPPGYYGAGAKTNAEGKYELTTGAAKGAVPGNYKVAVSRLVSPSGGPIVVEEGLDIEQLKMQGQAKESLPPKYSEMQNTDLTAQVEKGKAEGYDFALKGS